MNTLKPQTKTEVQEYVSFFKEYYPIDNLELCVLVCKEKDFKNVYAWLREGFELMEQQARESNMFRPPPAQIHSHDFGEAEQTACTVSTRTVLSLIEACTHSPNSENLKKILKGTEYFIMINDTRVLNYYGEKDHDFFFLHTLFHEMLHAIEWKTNKSIFRGSALAQARRDDIEIVYPLVKQFLKQKGAL